MASHFFQNWAISFHHVKCKANSLVDCLANEGVLSNSQLMEGELGYINDTALAHRYQDLASKDFFNLNVGATCPADDIEHLELRDENVAPCMLGPCYPPPSEH